MPDHLQATRRHSPGIARKAVGLLRAAWNDVDDALLMRLRRKVCERRVA
jgi:hypothetical protein